MLNELFICVDFEGTRPVLLFNHKQGVPANDDQVNFPLSTLFNIGDAYGFKHMPPVFFACGTADLRQSLLGQFTGAMKVVGWMVSPPLPPPFQSLS